LLKYSSSGFVKPGTKRQTASWQLRNVARLIQSVFSASKPPRNTPEVPVTYRGIQATRTHDLKALAALIPLELDFLLRAEALVELNPHAVYVRYAHDGREPQLSEAKWAFALAANVRAAVRKQATWESI